MRFFKLHDDEIYAVVDASAKVQVSLILARPGFDDGHKLIRQPHIELEGHSWRDFRRYICSDCEKVGDIGLVDRAYLCDECPKEIQPQ